MPVRYGGYGGLSSSGGSDSGSDDDDDDAKGKNNSGGSSSSSSGSSDVQGPGNRGSSDDGGGGGGGGGVDLGGVASSIGSAISGGGGGGGSGSDSTSTSPSPRAAGSSQVASGGIDLGVSGDTSRNSRGNADTDSDTSVNTTPTPTTTASGEEVGPGFGDSQVSGDISINLGSGDTTRNSRGYAQSDVRGKNNGGGDDDPTENDTPDTGGANDVGSSAPEGGDVRLATAAAGRVGADDQNQERSGADDTNSQQDQGSAMDPSDEFAAGFYKDTGDPETNQKRDEFLNNNDPGDIDQEGALTGLLSLSGGSDSDTTNDNNNSDNGDDGGSGGSGGAGGGGGKTVKNVKNVKNVTVERPGRGPDLGPGGDGPPQMGGSGPPPFANDNKKGKTGGADKPSGRDAGDAPGSGGLSTAQKVGLGAGGLAVAGGAAWYLGFL